VSIANLRSAQSEEQAHGVILALAKGCAEGRADRESDALVLAERFGLDQGWVRELFADARRARGERPNPPIIFASRIWEGGSWLGHQRAR
jgi:hypothetical protein